MRVRWRAGPLVREASLNVFLGGGGLHLLAGFALVTGAAVGVALAGQAMTIEAELMSLRSEGRGVVVFTTADRDIEVHIDRMTCEGLAARSDVERAGILVDTGRHDLATVGRDVVVFQASTSLAPALSTVDALVGDKLGYPHGQRRLNLDGHSVSAVVDDSGVPTTGMDSAVTVALPPAVVSGDECVVLLVPWARTQEVAAEAAATLRAEGGPVSAYAALREPVDVISRHTDRPERLLPVLAGLVGAVLTAIVTATRSSQLAAYRLSGTSCTQLLVLLWLEGALLAGLFAASGVLAAILLLGIGPSAAAGAVWILAGATVWVGLGSLAWPSAVRNPIHLAKDR